MFQIFLLKATLLLPCLSGQQARPQNLLEAKPQLAAYCELTGREGRILARLISLWVPVAAQDMQDMYYKLFGYDPFKYGWQLPDVLVVEDKLFNSGFKQDVANVMYWKKVAYKEMFVHFGPPYFYEATFCIPAAVSIEDKELSLFGSYYRDVEVKQLADLKNRKPLAVLKFSQKELKARQIPLQISVRKTGRSKHEDGATFAVFRPSLFPPLRQVRLGEFDSLDAMKNRDYIRYRHHDHGHKEMDFAELSALFPAFFPDINKETAPIFVRLEGVEEWINCEKLSYDKPYQQERKKPELKAYCELTGKEGKVIAKLITLWFSPSECSDEYLAGTAFFYWSEDPDLMAAADQVYRSGVKRLGVPITKPGSPDKVLGSIERRFVEGLVEGLRYEVTFCVPAYAPLHDKDLVFFEMWKTKGKDEIKKTADLKGQRPIGSLRFSEKELNSRRVYLQAAVDKVRTTKREPNAGYAVIRMNLWPPMDEVRIGKLDSIARKSEGRFKIIYDHGYELMRMHEQFSVLFPEPPDGQAPVFVRVKGIDHWIRCEKLPEGKPGDRE